MGLWFWAQSNYPNHISSQRPRHEMGRPKNSKNKNKTTIEKLVAQTTAAVPRSPNAVPPAYTTAGAMQPAPPLTNAQLFQELGTSGLMRFGGSVYEEWQRELMQKGKYGIYREMRDNNPVVNAVLFAVEMALRRVTFYFETENDKEEQLKDFLNGSLEDMSLTFQDTMTQIVSELQYGFSIFELVYKIRKGRDGEVQSKFDDGRISWRKWLPLAQETLAPGREWIWDETGGVRGINQLAPPDYQLRTLPIEKLLLFQTTHYKNDPEGRSLLRSMYVPYYFVKNFQEIEGISYERMGAGIPVMYMGSDTIKSGGAKNDTDFAKQVVRDVRSDEQSGVVIPYQKMGPDGRGMLLELLSTPGRSVIDFDKVITRYEQRMAMSALAQFIMLGMSNVGSYALSKDHSDIFVLSLSAWAQNIADVITRHALPRLLALNTFTYDQMPQMMHSEVSVPDLQALGTFINQMVGAQLLIPDSNLENYLRDAANLPKKEAGAPTVDDLREQKEEQAATLLQAQQQGVAQMPGQGFPPKKGEQGTPTSAKAEPGKVAEAKAEAPKEKASERFGGEGSGNFGHQGRPGEVGGSRKGGGTNSGNISLAQSRALKDYSEEGFKTINSELRTNNPSTSTRQAVRSLDSAIAKGKIESATTTYRGFVSNQIKDNWNRIKGAEFSDAAFISVSLDERTAYHFALASSNRGQPIVAKINLKGSQSAAFIPGNENELVLPRGSRFRVVDAEIDSKGAHRLTLDIVQ